MKQFNEKSLMALGECYVYGLVDPRNKKIFYIGKGAGNRIFDHEKEAIKNEDSKKLKISTIQEIKKDKKEVGKIIFNWGLTESEAFAAEAALINAFNFLAHNGYSISEKELSNIVAGHHSENAYTVEEFEKQKGAAVLTDEDIKHNLLVIKINKLYKRGMTEEEIYDIVRGCWKINLKRAKKCSYVLGVYNSLIVGVYKPTEWYSCNDSSNKKYLPTRDKDKNDAEFLKRKFFVDDNYMNIDESKNTYLYKSIEGVEQLKAKKGSRTAIRYFETTTKEVLK